MEPAQFCPSCGRRRGEDDRFCAGCGRPVDRPDHPGAGRPPGAAGSPPLPPWERLKIVVPIAILALGYWLIAPLVWPAFAPEPPVAEAPTAVPRAQPVAPPGLGGSTAGPASSPLPLGEGVPRGGAGQEPFASAAKGGVPGTAAGPKPTDPTSRTEPLAAGTPPSAATPTPSLYRGSPVEALKVDPRQVQTVRLGRVEAGTLVRMTFSVGFNSRLSAITGVPDIDLFVVGPTGTVAAYPDARDGVRVAFEAPATGDYEVRLDNSKSRINAKRVGIQFG